MANYELTDDALDLVTGGERVCEEMKNVTVNGKKVGDVVVCRDVPTKKDPPQVKESAPILE
jgi:hypothetical protein